MKSILDNLRQSIKTWTDEAAGKASEIAQTAATKAEELSKVGRLKMDIYQLQRECNRLYADLGRIAFKAMEKDASQSLEKQSGAGDLFAKIDGLNTEISAKEKELERLSRVSEPSREKKEEVKEKVAAAPPKSAPKAGAAAKKAAEPKKTATPRKTATASKSGTGAKKAAASKKSTTAKPTSPTGKPGGGSVKRSGSGGTQPQVAHKKSTPPKTG